MEQLFSSLYENDYKNWIRCFEWAQMGEKLGAGEILLTSIDNEGMQKGFETDLTERLSKALHSWYGGLGKKEDAKIVYEKTINAISFASVLHYNKFSISDIKKYLSSEKSVLIMVKLQLLIMVVVIFIASEVLDN